MPVSKSKQEVLSDLGVAGKHEKKEEREDVKVDRHWGERLAVFSECLEWLEAKRREYRIHPQSEDFKEVMEAMAAHRDYLNEQWHDGDTEEFKESLRRYMRACAAEMKRRASAHDVFAAPTQQSLEES